MERLTTVPLALDNNNKQIVLRFQARRRKGRRTNLNSPNDAQSFSFTELAAQNFMRRKFMTF